MLVSRSKSDLGCEDSQVEAEIYKLLLYEKGQHFLAHKDTEKVEGMFATMIVVLPASTAVWSRPLLACHEILSCKQEVN